MAPDTMPVEQKADLLERALKMKNGHEVLEDIADGTIPYTKLRKNLDEFDSDNTPVDYPGTDRQVDIDRFRGEVETGNGDTVEADMLYPKSRHDLLEEAGVEKSRWDGADGATRGEILEEDLAPHLLERDGYEVLCSGADCPGGNNGIDIIAWDPDANGGDGQIVIVETKYRSEKGGASAADLDSERDVSDNDEIDADGKVNQMTEDWIRDSWMDSGQNLDTDGVASDIKSRYGDAGSVEDAVDRAIRGGPETGYSREGFWATNNRDGNTISSKSSTGPKGEDHYMSGLFDSVRYAKLGPEN